MQIGLVGLGRMGANITRRLCRSDIHVVGFDIGPAAAEALAGEPGFEAAFSVDALLLALKAPRTVWCMLPAGAATRQMLDDLLARLAPGDCVVDGANGHYRETMARAARFEAAGIGFVDAGVSGGIWGLANGYSLMLGGPEGDIAALDRVWRALAPQPRQWLRCGPAGAGHFVKMIHNGIEYGLMQAYAEGFALMSDHPDFDLDLAAIASTWMQGSVVRSWLLELTRDLLAEDARLADVAPVVADSGEGRWTAQEAIDRGVPAPVITAALMQRFASQGRDDFAARVLATMRNRFGGHAIPNRMSPR
ncbi:MAG TPA: decarboxylating 6-phosphogluconate dehydrogenase [Usitatibacteraceae bacterium]|nr:decarboxylating 6-phosphogluconate dehydrogenase [Usitatibacteraceae bacterium]